MIRLYRSAGGNAKFIGFTDKARQWDYQKKTREFFEEKKTPGSFLYIENHSLVEWYKRGICR